jgi:hypothetical protein
MQKLHVVGFTANLDGLILSTRKGAKSGSFVVSVDPGVLRQLNGDSGRHETGRASSAGKAAEPATVRVNGSRTATGPRLARPESQLGPREMQDLLRRGWTLEEVAAEAGVDVDWVSRFAAPVQAEMRRVLDEARSYVFEKPRVGPSALDLSASVRRNVAERGGRFADEDFESCWRAHQLDGELWVIGFDYMSRGKRQSAEWSVDLELEELTSLGRLGTQLGHVQSARRKVSTTAPKPKPTKSATRAVPAAPTAPTPAARTAARSRQTTTTGTTKKKTASASAKSSRPRVDAPLPPAPASTSGNDLIRPMTLPAPRASIAQPPVRPASTPALPPSAPTPAPAPKRPVDPWREELRRRELERSAALAAEAAVAAAAPPPAPPPAPVPTRPAGAPPRTIVSTPTRPEPEPDPEPELRPVAIIGPTVRTLARRPPRREPEPPPPPPRKQATRSASARPSRPARSPEPVTGPTPAISDDLPNLSWSPGGRHGPLPAPEPVAVPEVVKERVASPLGTPEDVELGADTWFPPARPVFKGAQSAGGGGAGAGAPRRRRTEPLRGR